MATHARLQEGRGQAVGVDGSKDFDDAHREFDEEQIEMQEVMHACQ
jgi:hypothetical protein